MGITIWTTTDCNLQCRYCYEIKSKQRDCLSEVPNIDTCKILEWLKRNNLGTDRIVYHGGEPLLRFSTIKEITESLRRDNCLPERMGLTTNGLVWNDEIEYFFNKFKFFFEKDMSISIDGTEDMHNKCRKTLTGSGSYKKVLDTQKKLINIFPELRARMTIVPDSVDSLYEGVRCLVGLGFRTVVASLDYYDDRWSEELIQILKEQVIKIVEFWKLNQNLRLPFVDSILHRRPKGKCIFSYNIYPNGNIFPCIAVSGMDDFCIGNVIDGFYLDKIDIIRHELSKKYDLCKTCNNIKYCTYNRCKLVNYAINKNFTVPNILGCRIENLKLELEECLSNYINYVI